MTKDQLDAEFAQFCKTYNVTHPAYKLLCRAAFETAVRALTARPKAERKAEAGQQFTWNCEACGAAGEVDVPAGAKGRALRERVSFAHREKSSGCCNRHFEVQRSG